jgi:NAD+ diphosphatase
MKSVKPKLTVNIIVENERGEILFVKRKHDPFKGTWNTPGGFLEPQETGEEAACRELREETGLKLAPSALNYFASYTDRYHHVDGTVSDLLALAFWVRVKSSKAKITAASDAAQALFLDPKKVSWKEIGFKSDREAYRDYLKVRKTFS